MAMNGGKEIKRRELWTQEPFLISTFWFLGFNLQFTALDRHSTCLFLGPPLVSLSSRARLYEKRQVADPRDMKSVPGGWSL